MERGFIIYPTYEMTDEGPVVQLYGRLENGDTFRADFSAEPYFFIEKQHVQSAKQVMELHTTDPGLKTLDGQDVVRVAIEKPGDIPSTRRALEDAGVPTYEADIRFAYRFMIDNGLTAAVELDGEWTKSGMVDRVYAEPAIRQARDWSGRLVTLSIDIETDKRAKSVWSVSLATDDRTEKLIIGKTVPGAHCSSTEAELLTTLTRLVQEIDPDVITGWNVIDFDLKVLQEKYHENGIPMAWARSERECKLRLYNDFMRESSADIPGRMVLDGIMLLRSSFIKLDSYTLEAVSQEYLGEGKIFGGKGRFDQIKDAYTNDPELLLEYNLKDAQLVLGILEKSGALALTIKRSLITGMQMDRVRASIAPLDMLYLPRLRKRGHVAPTAGYIAKEEQVTGGFVMESKPGIRDYVIVCDFKSLYPSIMRTLNVDPLAYRPGLKKSVSDEEHVVAENGAVFDQELGILPGILQELWDRRDNARKEGDELARYAIKILMNSFYGALASPNCRFFSMEMANAITHTAQYTIKTTAQLVRDKGYDVIYGDTDSIFIDLSVTDEESAVEIGKKIEHEINAFLKEHTKERYKRESFLELEFEKVFVRFLMPMTRSGEGSKKRYAGLVRKGGKEEIDFTGLEFVRRDWTEVAKEFQLEILELVFHGKDPKDYIRSYVEDVRKGKRDDLLVYRKALRKKLDDYTKTTPPHVKAARLMEEIEGNIIEYVQTVDGPEPVSNLRHSIDYDHYIERQLKPIADSILVFYGTSFDDVLLGTKQKGLFDF